MLLQIKDQIEDWEPQRGIQLRWTSPLSEGFNPEKECTITKLNERYNSLNLITLAS